MTSCRGWSRAIICCKSNICPAQQQEFESHIYKGAPSQRSTLGLAEGNGVVSDQPVSHKAGTRTCSFSSSSAVGIGSKLSSVITAFECLLAEQSLGSVSPVSLHIWMISFHSRLPSLRLQSWFGTCPPVLGRLFLYLLWGLLSALPCHDPVTCLPHHRQRRDQQLTHNHRQIGLSGPEFTPDVQAMQKEKDPVRDFPSYRPGTAGNAS